MRHLPRYLSAALLACAASSSIARVPDAAPPAQAKPQAPVPVPPALASFFGGEWSGRGQFASGRPIEADVSFRLELDGQWLQYRHADRAPNSYKALGMWGVDSTTRKLVMTINDNGGGARTFEGGGWNDGAVTFLRTISVEPLREERFVFTRLAENRFRMAYEVHVAPKDWRMIDELVFERR
jgi:hypothetical protein